MDDSAKELNGEQLTAFLSNLEDWLKAEKGLSGYSGARYQRSRIVAGIRNLIEQVQQPTLPRILDYADSKRPLEEAMEDSMASASTLAEYIRTIFTPPEEVQRLQEVVQAEQEAPPAGSAARDIIGRVSLSLRKPAKASEFTFWIRADEGIHMEPGRLVTAAPHTGLSLVGIVSDVEATSDVDSPIDSFYAHAYGRPEEELATLPTTVATATVEVVFRSDRLLEPPRGSWPIYFATAPEIRQAYGAADIPEQFQILGGFTYDDRRNPVAIPLDARYLVGYEAAHVNIAGASGAAAKTSYGLFLLQNLLAWGGRQSHDVLPGGVAAIAFNVKEADLMRIDDLPPWDEADEYLQLPRLKESLPLWRFCRENLDIDPHELARGFRFFAPIRDDGRLLTTRDPTRDTTGFSYGLMDLIDVGPGSLFMLFDPRDIDDTSSALIFSIADEVRAHEMSFRQLFADLQTRSATVRSQGGGRGRSSTAAPANWISIGGSVHHQATIQKVRNRLQGTVQHQLRGLLAHTDLRGHPLPLHELRAGNLWVVDISKLHDKGQRMVFHHILTLLHRILEAKKTGERTVQIGGLHVNADDFPDRVAVMVDELNKFAPSGREYSALKSDVIDIAARGRSVGLGLVGIQQLASNVDDEILANASTFAVGRTHILEARKTPYGWLPSGLRERATILEKGWVLVWHSVHKRPVLVHFPVPLHFLRAEYAALRG